MPTPRTAQPTHSERQQTPRDDKSAGRASLFFFSIEVEGSQATVRRALKSARKVMRRRALTALLVATLVSGANVQDFAWLEAAELNLFGQPSVRSRTQANLHQPRADVGFTPRATLRAGEVCTNQVQVECDQERFSHPTILPPRGSADFQPNFFVQRTTDTHCARALIASPRSSVRWTHRNRLDPTSSRDAAACGRSPFRATSET